MTCLKSGRFARFFGQEDGCETELLGMGNLSDNALWSLSENECAG
jgi:hypothetical protein